MIALAIQFLGLFIPAMVAVVGSYWLYRNKQGDQREALRYSLLSELVFMEMLESWPEERANPRLIPLQNLVPTQAYEANASQLGLLTTNEIANVVRFYSTAQLVNNAVERAHRMNESNPGVDLDLSSLQEDIAAVKEQRQNAIDALNEAIKEDIDRYEDPRSSDISNNLQSE